MSTVIDDGEVCAEVQQVGRFDYRIAIVSRVDASPAEYWYRIGRTRAERKASLELLRFVRRREWESGPSVIYRTVG
jgi:hypothetical protein